MILCAPSIFYIVRVFKMDNGSSARFYIIFACLNLMLSAAAAIKDEVISTEVQTSTFLLQNLVNKEVNFVKKLYKYIQEVSKQSNQVRKIRNTIDSNHSLRNSISNFSNLI